MPSASVTRVCTLYVSPKETWRGSDRVPLIRGAPVASKPTNGVGFELKMKSVALEPVVSTRTYDAPGGMFMLLVLAGEPGIAAMSLPYSIAETIAPAASRKNTASPVAALTNAKVMPVDGIRFGING